MNISKRIVCALMCIAMLLSMSTSFAFAEDPAPLFSEAFVGDSYINADKAVYLTDDATLAAAENGAQVELTWRGELYTFVKGVNAFSTLAEVEAAALENPHILFKMATTGATDFYASKPASFFTENYDVSPFVKGTAKDGSDWTSNVGTGEGQFNPANSAEYSNFGVKNNTAVAGDYNFYGFTINSCLVDWAPDNSMHIENCYFNLDSWASYALIHGHANKGQNVATKLVLKNNYITVKSGSVGALVNNGDVMSPHFEIDSVFVDVEAFSCAEKYSQFKQAGNNTMFYVHDSNWRGFKNYWLSKTGKVTEGVTSVFKCTNNIFKDSYFGFVWNIVCAPEFDAYTEVIFDSNNVYTKQETKNNSYGYIFGSIASAYSTVASPALKLTITNNFMKSQHSSGAGSLTTGSDKCRIFDPVDISNNYVTTPGSTEGFQLKYSSNTQNLKASTWIISEDGSKKSNSLYPVTFEGEALLENDSYNTAPAAELNLAALLDKGENTKLEGFSNAECTSALNLSSVNATADTTVYVKVTSLDGTASKVYAIAITVDVSHNMETKYDANGHWTECSDDGCDEKTALVPHSYADVIDTTCDCGYTRTINYFATNYVGDSYINAEKAILLSSKVASAADGEAVEVEWCGTKYVFIKGTNAFATLAEIQDKNFDNPHVLVESKTEGDPFYPQFPGSFFTQNYKNNPVKKGTAIDGSDWAANIGTGAGQFNPNIGVIYNNIGPNYSTVAGDYKFYGFTMTYSVIDYSSVANMYMENCYFSTRNWAGNNLSYFKNKTNGETVNKIVFKNIYITPQSASNVGRLFASGTTLPEYFEMDSVFFDLPQAVEMTGDHFYNQAGPDYTWYVHDSCFKNFQYYKLAKHVDKYTVSEGVTAKSIWENNVMFNSYLAKVWDEVFGYMLDDFTEIKLVGNKVTTTASAYLFGSIHDYASTSACEPALKFTLKDNYMANQAGANNSIGSRRFDADALEFSNNFVALPSNKDVGVQIMYNGGAIKAKTWLIAADGSNTSSMIQPGVMFEEDVFDEEEIINLDAQSSTVDVKDLITAAGNIIKGYSDEECETELDLANVAVPAAGCTIYVKVLSPDGLTAENHTVVIEKDPAFTIFNEGKGSTFDATKDGKDFYWVTWRGEVTSQAITVENGEETTHRVGAIYYSSLDNLYNVMGYINNTLKVDAKTIEDVDSVIADVNAQYASAKNIKTYAFSKDHTLTWDNETQTYGYRYNFNVQKDYYRGVVMYVVYTDAEGNLQVEFSNEVVQQSGAEIA